MVVMVTLLFTFTLATSIVSKRIDFAQVVHMRHTFKMAVSIQIPPNMKFVLSYIFYTQKMNFFNKKFKRLEIQTQITAIYYNSTKRLKWSHEFLERRTDVDDKHRIVRPSLINENILLKTE